MVEYNIDLSGKTILVTGAAGFIGSNLVKRIFKDFPTAKVVGLDSITDYYDVNIKYERLKEIQGIVDSFNSSDSCSRTIASMGAPPTSR